MTRQQQRAAWHAGLFAFAGFFLIFGSEWSVSGIPGTIFGALLLGFAVVGLLGVNIWSGGPLDPRNDPPPEGLVTERVERRWKERVTTAASAKVPDAAAQPDEAGNDRLLCGECGFRYLKLVGSCPKCNRRDRTREQAERDR